MCRLTEGCGRPACSTGRGGVGAGLEAMFCVAVTAADTQYFVFLPGLSRVKSLNLSMWHQRAKYKLMLCAFI
jgi:hypothetical protein